jgi:hypothetical protein
VQPEIAADGGCDQQEEGDQETGFATRNAPLRGRESPPPTSGEPRQV